jgi:hypothetical protein
MNMATTPGKAFYERQIDFLTKQDVEGLIKTQYHTDAVLVGFDFTRRGHAELIPHFKAYLANLGGIKLLSTDKFTEIDDAIFFEATVEVAAGQAVVYDVFTFKDGKAIRHFTGLKSFTPKQS